MTNVGVRQYISVLVTAVKTGYPSSAPVESTVATVEMGAPIKATAIPTLSVGAVVAKTARLGRTVIATAGTWPISALSLTYQWQVNRNDSAGYVNLAGATTKQLLLNSAIPADFMEGFTYRIVVSATRTGQNVVYALDTTVFQDVLRVLIDLGLGKKAKAAKE